MVFLTWNENEKINILLYLLSCSLPKLDEKIGSLLMDSQFDNDLVTLLFWSEPRNFLNMIQKRSCFIVDQRFLYEKYESKFEEGEEVLNPQQMEEDLFNHIVWAPRIYFGYLKIFLLFSIIEFGNKLLLLRYVPLVQLETIQLAHWVKKY
ncbi:hypothetical protein AHAS_Ahas05G0061100 [Arachis hypogaea]